MTEGEPDATPGPVMLRLDSGRGPVSACYHPAPEGAPVVIMVGGGDGGLDGPAGLYPLLVPDLEAIGVGALRVDFRVHQFPGPLEEGVHDVLVALEYLATLGIERCGLLGHSFGGAVVIEAAIEAREDATSAPRAPHTEVASVATLASQTAGAQRVAQVAPVPLLLVHGLDDIRLSPDCSRWLYAMAGEPRRLELLEGATHSLRQRHDDVRALLVEWFAETLEPR
jgi:pimeloyl-ACP methyl ester carboxylesterase